MSIGTSLLAGVAFGLAMAAPPGPMNAVIAEESVRSGFPAGVRAGLGAMTGDAIFCVLAFVGVVEIIEHAPTLRAVMVGTGGVLMCVFAVDAARSVRDAGHSPDGDESIDDESTDGDESSDVDASGAVDGSTNVDASSDASGDVRTDDRGDTDTPARAGTPDGGLARSTGFRKALALSLTNPYQIVFWLTVGVGLLRPGTLDLAAQAAWLSDLLVAAGGSGSLVIETGSAALLVGFFGGIGIWITSYPAAVAALGERSERAGPAITAISAVVLGAFGVVFLVDGAATLG